ncbi:MAG: hypothetical protein ACE5FA_12885 [Dehalococcoidia bacterium]
MIKRRTSRRVAITALGGLSATAMIALLGWWPGLDATPRTQQGTTPTYTPPTWWDNYPAASKQYFLAWDQVFWQFEVTQPPPAQAPASTAPFNPAGALVLSIMSQVGQDTVKANLASLLAVSNRGAYLPHLIPGLDPARSSEPTRRTLVGAMKRIQRKTGGTYFTREVRQALQTSMQAETHAPLKREFSVLLERLSRR